MHGHNPIAEAAHSQRAKDKHANETRLLHSRENAAWLLCCSVRTIDYLIAGKHFVTRRIGSRVFITHASLLKFIASDHCDSVVEAA
jgi:hypothetical protein